MISNRDAWDYISELEDNSVDAIITDPPYTAKINLAEMKRVCRGNIVVFCGPKTQFFVPDEFLFWIKTPSTKNYSKHCGNFVEMILVLRRGETFNKLHWSQMTGVYDDRLVAKPEHPHQKPLSLMERLVRIYTDTGDTILDPFAGSGTTLLAATNLLRNGVGCELDSYCCGLANRRAFWQRKANRLE